MHVWVTKERGELYGRVQGVRLLKKGFSAWQDCLSALKLIEGDLSHFVAVKSSPKIAETSSLEYSNKPRCIVSSVDGERS